MVRSSSSKGRKERAGKDLILGKIDENSVKTLESRGAAFVGPSVSSVQEGQFDKAHVVDAIVKSFSFNLTEVRVVFLMSIPDHICRPLNLRVLSASVFAPGSRTNTH